MIRSTFNVQGSKLLKKLEEDKYRHIQNTIMAIAGSFLYTLGIRLFITPHKLFTGGLPGLSIILEYLTGLPAGVMSAVISLPVFLLGYRYLSKGFLFKTFLSMLYIAFFLDFNIIFQKFFYLDDLLASCLMAGVFYGLGIGLVLKSGSALGGATVINFIIKKKWGLNFTTTNFIMSSVVVLIGTMINDFTSAVYTVIYLFLGNIILKKVLIGFNQHNLVLIISEKYKEIAEKIMTELGHGVTLLRGRGAYTNDDKCVIYCIIPTGQIVQLKKFIKKTDKTAFVCITETSEIQGERYKKHFV
jgi:uncharacterized membrane-anchored protein YitT (DUF2179 family)